MVPDPKKPDLPKTAILTGTTASGKTSVALHLCQQRPDIEIINADSLLIYRELNIGSAKPSDAELASVPHHLVNICTPDQVFTAGDFYPLVMQTIAGIHQRGKRALIVGGTGFYLKSLIYGLWDAPRSDPKLREQFETKTNTELYRELESLDPECTSRIHMNDRYRIIRALEMIVQSGSKRSEMELAQNTTPDPQFDLLIIDREPDDLNQRIEARTRSMIDQGLVAETRALLHRYPEARPLLSVGYAETIRFLKDLPAPGRKLEPGIEGLISEIALATRQLAKRQRTWFRGQHDGQWFILDRDQHLLLDHLNRIYTESLS